MSDRAPKSQARSAVIVSVAHVMTASMQSRRTRALSGVDALK
jgi:hypothetical protein